MMREHERGHVIRRLLAPPAAPALVRPRPAHRPEHVAAEDPGADVLEAARGDVVVDAALATLAVVHALPGAGAEEPLEHLRPADPEGKSRLWSGPAP
jgi:hypothetical protein